MRRAGARAMFSTVATILLVSAPACPASPQSGGLLGGAGQVAVGKPAPALLARTFSGEKIELAALRGRVVVLNFWASWCGPCRSEMPALDALYHEYRDRGVVVIGLSADDPHDRKDALNAAGVVGYLTGMLSEASTNGFGAPQMLPMTYVIGAGGSLDSILRANRGALSAAQLRAVVEAELQKNAGR
ncbi:MAG: TlpA family protein disulfide reductase [Steroidobacteraceae bacterium]